MASYIKLMRSENGPFDLVKVERQKSRSNKYFLITDILVHNDPYMHYQEFICDDKKYYNWHCGNHNDIFESYMWHRLLDKNAFDVLFEAEDDDAAKLLIEVDGI